MKSILYAGAALMIGASIYGFVDYKKTSHKKQFTDMYKDVKENKPAPFVRETSIVAERGVLKNDEKKVINKTTVTEKTALRNQKEVSKEKMIPAEKIVLTNDEPEETGSKEKVKIHRKKISPKIFSRAPIREEMEENDDLPVTENGDKKMELKRQ